MSAWATAKRKASMCLLPTSHGHTSLRQRPCSIKMPSNRWSAFLAPRELIFRQSSARVEYANLVRWIFIPPPENKVMVIRGHARGKARDKNSNLTLTVKPADNFPRRRLFAGRQQSEPAACQIFHLNGMFGAGLNSPQIGDVVTGDLVGAQDAWIDLVSETLIGLLHGSYDVQAEVKSRHASRVETGSPDCCSIAREGLERPLRIMRAKARLLKPHANPPIARWSR